MGTSIYAYTTLLCEFIRSFNVYSCQGRALSTAARAGKRFQKARHDVQAALVSAWTPSRPARRWSFQRALAESSALGLAPSPELALQQRIIGHFFKYTSQDRTNDWTALDCVGAVRCRGFKAIGEELRFWSP